MYHPYVVEMQARQKIEAMTAEGLRSQELKKQREKTEQRTGQRQPVQAEESAPPRYGIAARLLSWMQRNVWSSPPGINIEL